MILFLATVGQYLLAK